MYSLEDKSSSIRKKVKAIINSSNYVLLSKEKLSPIISWRNYHRYCKMNGSVHTVVHPQESMERFNRNLTAIKPML